LTRYVTADANLTGRAGTRKIARADMQRRKARSAEIIDCRTDADQTLDKIADGAFVHPLDAADAIVAAVQRQRRGERTDGGSGIADEDIGVANRESGRIALNDNRITLVAPDDAKHTQGLEHHAGIVRIQQITQARLTIRQRRHQ